MSKTPHERAMDRLMVLSHRLHVPADRINVLVICLECCEAARDALEIVEARPDAHQLVSLPELRAAIARVDEAVLGP